MKNVFFWVMVGIAFIFDAGMALLVLAVALVS